MGACTQRPTKEELQNHDTVDILTFDPHFLPLPALSASLEVIRANQAKILQEQARLKSALAKYNEKSKAYTRGALEIPSLRIEVKKGKDIGTGATCFANASPSVKVSLEPEGPVIFTTKEGTAEIPQWFQFFEVKQSLDSFTSVKFDVLIDGAPYGKFEMPLAKLGSQLVSQQWFTVTGGPPGGKPEVLVRTQLVKDESEVIAMQIAECERLLKELGGLTKH